MLRGQWQQRLDLLAVLGCGAAYLLCSAPARPCCATPVYLPVLAGAIGFPFALWKLARVVLADDRGVPATAWAGLTVLLASGLLAAADYLAIAANARLLFAVLNKVAAFGFVGAALLTAWRTWDGDLVEPRRRLRWLLVGYLGIYGLVILVGEVYLFGRPPPPWLDLANVVLIDLTMLAMLLFLATVKAQSLDILFGPSAPPAPRHDSESMVLLPELGGGERDAVMVHRLRRLMEDERLYREPNLSLGGLARKLGVPEYVLRRIVHEQLGLRNFAAFVNGYRLAEVADRLRDPALQRRPVLTLALEAGFGSIGPFNRAFRDRYGVTPTEYRSAPQGVASGGAGDSLADSAEG